MAEDEKGGRKQPTADRESSQDISWGKVAAVVGAASSVVGLLAFFGVSNFNQLKQAFSQAASPSPTASYSFSYIPPPDTYSPPPVPTTYAPVIPSTPAFDPGSLDNAQTDQTPFTEAALLPLSFTDGKGVHYSLVTGGQRACINPSMSSNVQYLLNNSSVCSAAMAGDYLVDNGVATENSDVMVSVQVFPLDSASTAQQIYNDLTASGAWNFGIWCPTSGLGANACGSGYSSARIGEFIRIDHRYLVEAEAVYTDLTQDATAVPWIDSAAQQADDVCGPENYAGNQ